ncbi:VOC family protein [Streptomyces griseosporeus]|jgi:predicted 3-demethylubiquinone-9 3-methyltransferase (glyoxalase superfamily)|uniref:VOC family protein n=1 Tax=Streptomyces griseosporeus TaxID=1910 RepID=UPI0036A72F1D
MTADGFVTCLWFDDQAEEAAHYYVSIFKNSSLGKVTHYLEGAPRPAGSVLTVDFTANGQKFVALNGGPEFTFNEAISFQILCDDQQEVDHYWTKLTENGGEPGPCGWLKDRYGVSWQVVPKVLLDMVASTDHASSTRAMNAMMAMGKLDIAALEKAYAGE